MTARADSMDPTEKIHLLIKTPTTYLYTWLILMYDHIIWFISIMAFTYLKLRLYGFRAFRDFFPYFRVYLYFFYRVYSYFFNFDVFWPFFELFFFF